MESDCGALVRSVREALQRLAAPAEVQNAYIANNRMHHDELALELNDVLGAAISNCGFSAEQSAGLQALGEQLDRMSGQVNAHLWTASGVGAAAEWKAVRRLASTASRGLRE